MQDNLNPFSTRFIKPGAIPFQSTDVEFLDQLIQKLIAHEWTGEIIGPHGSGKSTLIESLKTHIDKEIRHETIRIGDDHLALFNSIKSWLVPIHAESLLIIDGIEQLSSDQQNQIIRLCKEHRIGLLVSSHQTIGLPLIHEAKTEIDSFRRIVYELVGDRSISLTEEEIEYAFNKYHPNLREALFSLYDVYELKRRKHL